MEESLSMFNSSALILGGTCLMPQLVSSHENCDKVLFINIYMCVFDNIYVQPLPMNLCCLYQCACPFLFLCTRSPFSRCHLHLRRIVIVIFRIHGIDQLRVFHHAGIRGLRVVVDLRDVHLWPSQMRLKTEWLQKAS